MKKTSTGDSYTLQVSLYFEVNARHDPRDVAADVKASIESAPGLVVGGRLTDVRYAVQGGTPVSASGIPAPKRGDV